MRSLVLKNLILLVGVLFMLAPHLAFAHGMDLRLVEPGVFQVEYDGGGFSPRTEVVIYGDDGTELGSGLVDEEGKFHFDPELMVHRAVANDSMGHRAVYRDGLYVKTLPKLPVVIVVFIVVGLLYYFYERKIARKKS